MTKRGKPRKFPYYIVTEIDEKDNKIHILDLNSIQIEKFDEVDGRSKRTVLYETDTEKHDAKWITVPGNTAKEQKKVVDWIKEMVFPDDELHADKYMVYDHRRHFTDPFHEEYKVDTFREWEEDIPEDESEDDEEIVLDEETEDEE